MKKRILVLAAGFLTVLAVWIFVPERTEGSAVFVTPVEEIYMPYVPYEVIDFEHSIIKGVEIKKEKTGSRKAEKNVDILVEDKEVAYEPETSEEVGEEMVAESEGVVLDGSIEGACYTNPVEETWVETLAETVACETQSQVPAETIGVAEVETGVPSVPSEQVSAPGKDIYGLLRSYLDAAGIGWWYPYAVAQMTQESHCNPWAENTNGLDKGLFQYRITYWTEPESIFDVNAQIRKYTQQVSARLASGLSIEETISRHYTSDYCPGINWEYVNHVLSWMN